MPDWAEVMVTANGPLDDVIVFVEKSSGTNGLVASVSSLDDTDAKEEALTEVLASFRLDGCVPTPVELLDGSAPFDGDDTERDRLVGLYGHADWYDWRAANWGTKWDVDATENRDDPIEDIEASIWAGDGTETLEAEVVFHFDTAWAAPFEWLSRVGPMFPTVDFEVRDYTEYPEGIVATSNGGVVSEPFDVEDLDEGYE